MRYRQTSDSFQPPDYRNSKYRERAAEVVESVPIATENPVLSFTVMAHPKRKEWAEELAAQIPATITWDQKNDRHDTGYRAIKAHDVNATHHVVVQDDVILAGNFAESVTEACKYADSKSPIGLYYGGKGKSSSAHARAAIEAEEHSASWIVRKGPIWGPAIVYPVATIPNLLEYFKVSIVENYDRRVMRYYQSLNRMCWYTFPSLVEHRQEGNPSLCGHDKGNRVAKRFAGPQGALEVDWSGPVLKAKW
jgi:hypothetical protein